MSSIGSRLRKLAPGLLGGMLLTASCALGAAVDLIVRGDNRDLRERRESAPESSPRRPALLVIALDGIDRKLLYDMLEKAELPEMEKLLSGGGGKFPHAHFDKTLLSTLPSTTIAAWVTAFTGAPPAVHGVSGNEFFIRPSGQFAAPIPVTFSDSQPVLDTYTDAYVDKLYRVPTVYEKMRKRDPNVLIWVGMHQVQRGADQLLVTGRTVIADAFAVFLTHEISARLTRDASKEMWATLDANVMDTVVEQVEDANKPVADVITVYLSGTDNFAHLAEDGPDKSRREYLSKVIEPLLGELRKQLAARNALKNRYVVVTSDHGHTEILDDDAHALSTEGPDDPPRVLEHAGFRVRPFQLEVSDDVKFDAVLAYQGAIAYVYLADRSRCGKKAKRCDFSVPPRFEEDVLVAAEAFYSTSQQGKHVPKMKGTLDLVLARRPTPFAETDLPFQVYVGDGRLVPIAEYLGAHAHPSYLAFEQRLRELAVGPLGERAGDVLLLANNGNRDRAEDRYYFSFRYRSWHGSPSRKDSEVPLIVAHPGKTRNELARETKRAIGEQPRLQKITDLLLALRFAADPAVGSRSKR